MTWWVKNFTTANGKQFFPKIPDVEIYLDESMSGWGAVCNGVMVRGPWTSSDKMRYINELEPLGALFALESFLCEAVGLLSAFVFG